MGDSFVGDSECGFLKQSVRQRKIGCEVEKCEESRVVADEVVFRWLRFFDLHDEIGGGPDLFGGVRDLASSVAICVVVVSTSGACTRLY